MRRWPQGAFAAGLLVLSSVLSVSALQETVDLQVKLARGEVVEYALTNASQESVDLGFFRSSGSAQSEAREVLRVLDVAVDGSMQIEVMWENFKVTSGGSTSEVWDTPLTVQVAPDGRLLQEELGKELEATFFTLPGRPLRPGESWTRQSKRTEGRMTIQTTETFVLEAVEGSGDDRVARVRRRAEGTAGGTNLLEGLPPGFSSRSRGVAKENGLVHWSLAKGRPIRSEHQESMEILVEIFGAGGVGRGTFTNRSTTRREALAPAPAPAVAADFLITPGKGIGAFAVDATVAAVSGALGQARDRAANVTMWGADRGFKAAVISWQNGLVGYLDPADSSRLIALAVADRRYRTEKGLGYGSSQGAVLLAHGRPQIRVDMPGAQGSVVLLIYNDLGIAFALNSDKKQTFGRAREGTVDWIAVFPSGIASKIYPVP